jgi:hypothetical protein
MDALPITVCINLDAMDVRPTACCTDIDSGHDWAGTRPARTGGSRALPLQHGTNHVANGCKYYNGTSGGGARRR